jgi:hypothetical protein
MYFTSLYQVGQEISVHYPDLNINHRGIIYSVQWAGDGWRIQVIHNSKRGGGVCVVSLEEFENGNRSWISRSPRSEEHRAAILQNARNALSHGLFTVGSKIANISRHGAIQEFLKVHSFGLWGGD